MIRLLKAAWYRWRFMLLAARTARHIALTLHTTCMECGAVKPEYGALCTCPECRRALPASGAEPCAKCNTVHGARLLCTACHARHVLSQVHGLAAERISAMLKRDQHGPVH